jgi:hypothetical protein
MGLDAFGRGPRQRNFLPSTAESAGELAAEFKAAIFPLRPHPFAVTRRHELTPTARHHRRRKSRSAAQARQPATIGIHMLIRQFLIDYRFRCG